MTKGTLEIITGPMFAGKTSALLKKARSFAGEMVLIKPSFDTRYGICEIKTHDGVAAEAFNLTNTSEILESQVIKKAQAVFFDEIQFFMEPYFGGDVISCINTLLNRGLSVVCCGLDMNWKGEPFEIISKLKTIADRYTVLHARCSVCNEPAIFTYKRGGSKSNIELGAAEIYEPRCAKHYPFSSVYDPEDEEQNDMDLRQGELFEL
ncbi:MAG: thymidine kinase [Alphaproteobacteria bacterium]|nr:thymidine kinase [Alphaproteobacteria bacterium]